MPIGAQPRQLLSPEVAAKIDQMIVGVVQRGTGRAAAMVPDARGKPGTTNNGVDVLFIGYSPSLNLLTAIWMGNDDNRPAEQGRLKVCPCSPWRAWHHWVSSAGLTAPDGRNLLRCSRSACTG